MSLNDSLGQMGFGVNIKRNEDCVNRGREVKGGRQSGCQWWGYYTPLHGKCFTMQPSDVEEGASTRVQLINHISFLM